MRLARLEQGCRRGQSSGALPPLDLGQSIPSSAEIISPHAGASPVASGLAPATGAPPESPPPPPLPRLATRMPIQPELSRSGDMYPGPPWDRDLAVSPPGAMQPLMLLREGGVSQVPVLLPGGYHDRRRGFLAGAADPRPLLPGSGLHSASGSLRRGPALGSAVGYRGGLGGGGSMMGPPPTSVTPSHYELLGPGPPSGNSTQQPLAASGGPNGAHSSPIGTPNSPLGGDGADDYVGPPPHAQQAQGHSARETPPLGASVLLLPSPAERPTNGQFSPGGR